MTITPTRVAPLRFKSALVVALYTRLLAVMPVTVTTLLLMFAVVVALLGKRT